MGVDVWVVFLGGLRGGRGLEMVHCVDVVGGVGLGEDGSLALGILEVRVVYGCGGGGVEGWDLTGSGFWDLGVVGNQP
jgi:hypothetical protein